MTTRIYNRKIQMSRRKELRKRETTAEKILWSSLRRRNINNIKFYRQYGIGAYIADFYAPSLRLCIEVDGKQHHTETGSEYDAERDNYMESLNIQILRFKNELVIEDTVNIVSEIKRAIKLILDSEKK
ncbi:MAG: endonuclease domain-containing protein [Candidatus Cloacimonetes bacterium]|nr:endonuclease domain-containing protein [Candidatus Cloacimonadota bacterium]